MDKGEPSVFDGGKRASGKHSSASTAVQGEATYEGCKELTMAEKKSRSTRQQAGMNSYCIPQLQSSCRIEYNTVLYCNTVQCSTTLQYSITQRSFDIVVQPQHCPRYYTATLRYNTILSYVQYSISTTLQYGIYDYTATMQYNTWRSN